MSLVSNTKKAKRKWADAINVSYRCADGKNILYVKSDNIIFSGVISKFGRYNKALGEWAVPFIKVKEFINEVKSVFDASLLPKPDIVRFIRNKLKIEFGLYIEITNMAKLYPLFKIRRGHKEFFSEIRRKVGFKHPNEINVRRYSLKDLKNWDGYVVPVQYDWEENCMYFDVGYVDIVKELLESKGFYVEIRDRRDVFPIKDKIECDIELWKPQKEAFDVIIDSLQKNGKALYQLPPGLGKTEMAMYIIHKLGVKTIILVNGRDLLYQWVKRIDRKLGFMPGIVGDGIFEPKDITVATLQSLWEYIKRNNNDVIRDVNVLEKFIDSGGIDDVDFAPIDNDEFFSSFSLVVLDEVHVGAASTYLAVLRSFTAKYFLGQSATTWRTDRFHPLLWGVFGKPVFVYDMKRAISDGYLVEPIVYLYESDFELSDFYDWSYAESKLIECESRNNLIARIVESAPKPCVVFTRRKKHQKLISLALNEIGVSHRIANGSTPSDERKKLIKDLDNCVENVAVITPIWEQGINIPSLKSVVLAYPIKSDVSLIQMVGRAIRKSKNKDFCHIYDFIDKYRTFKDRLWARINVYKKYNWKVIKK